jgi:hypothetical protein
MDRADTGRVSNPRIPRKDVGTSVAYWQRTALTSDPSKEGVKAAPSQTPKTMSPLGSALPVLRSRLMAPVGLRSDRFARVGFKSPNLHASWRTAGKTESLRAICPAPASVHAALEFALGSAVKGEVDGEAAEDEEKEEGAKHEEQHSSPLISMEQRLTFGRYFHLCPQ